VQRTTESNASLALQKQKAEETAELLEKELTVQTTNLSSSVRKKTSAEDSRKSSAALGLVGAVVAFAPLALIVVSDVFSLLAHVVRRCKALFTNAKMI
jgi:hypothetical protein